jgi:hypothetical protein
LKVATTEPGMMDIIHACTCAALMLTDRKYLIKFNGHNFDIITIKNPIKKPKSKVKGGGGDIDIIKTPTIKLPEFMYDIVDGFKHIIHDLNNPASIYKTTSLKAYVSLKTDGRTYYDNDTAREIASEYTEKQLLINDYPGVRNYAVEVGIWEDITAHMDKSKYHNTHKIDDLYEKKKTIKSRSEFYNKYPNEYAWLSNNKKIKNGPTIEEFFFDMPSKVIPMTLERAKEFISKCTKLTDLNGTKKGASVATWLRTKGLYEEMTKHLIRSKVHTEESAKQDAISAGSPTIFNKERQGAYMYAKRNGLLEKIYKELGWKMRNKL